jgi:hypothetical protein
VVIKEYCGSTICNVVLLVVRFLGWNYVEEVNPG